MDRRRFSVSKVVLFVFVAVLSLVSFACEPGGFPIIDNQFRQDVRVWVTRVNDDGSLGETRDYGIVESSTVKKLASITFIRRAVVFRIVAISSGGEIVFSQDYNMDDLEKIGWKITIQP